MSITLGARIVTTTGTLTPQKHQEGAFKTELRSFINEFSLDHKHIVVELDKSDRSGNLRTTHIRLALQRQITTYRTTTIEAAVEALNGNPTAEIAIREAHKYIKGLEKFLERIKSLSPPPSLHI